MKSSYKRQIISGDIKENQDLGGKKDASTIQIPDKLTRSTPKKLDRDGGGGSGKLQRSTPKKLDR